VKSVVTALASGAVLALVALSGAVLPLPAAGAADGSAVTVAAKDHDAFIEDAPLPDLEVTVSQTKDLVNQGIEISWTGGEVSTRPSGSSGGTNFLQIMQCWGDDPKNPGQPDRTTCQYGIKSPGTARDDVRSSIEVVAPEDLPYTVPGTGFLKPTYTSIPFRARDGDVVSGIATAADGTTSATNTDVNNNKFFTSLTTNQVPWVGSGSDGTGSAKFELQTGAQSPGLGCGNPITGSSGTVSGASCWLVIIPRGTADADGSTVSKSGLFFDSWKHRIAVKLDFRALGTRCTVGAAERQLAGSELIGGAVASWQPVLCSAKGGSVYSLISGAESDSLAAANGKAPAPLALTTRPLQGDGKDNLQYAPVALTGITVGFAVDRVPNPFGGAPDDAVERAGLPMESLNLTPRLMAKLLTNSYIDSLPNADRSHIGYKSQSDPGKNAQNLSVDPDFLAVNDEEWAYQSLSAASLADLLIPQGRSDAAWAVWAYVMADKDAVAFLAGEPDPWGMTVNPWSSTSASVNRSGNALALPRDNFPKADPIEAEGSDLAGPVNLVTWRPYTNDLDSSAYLTLRGDGQLLGAWDSFAMPPKYGKAARSLPGSQKVLGLTDAASAARYVVVSAALLNPAGTFVTPTTASFTAAAAAMTPSPAQPQVLSFDPASTAARSAPDAYPLTVPVYAASNPAMTDPVLRKSYAEFIYYAASGGQQPGKSLGDLPDGYAPLPDAWRAVARSAADVIYSGALPTKPTATVPRPRPTPTTASAPAPGVAAPVVPVPESTPTPTGDPAGALTGAVTPDDPNIVLVSATVPIVVVVALVAALLVPLLSRFRKPL